jgi:hypothetical protein
VVAGGAVKDDGRMADETDHLETEYVFIDTEAYVREKFDWGSKSFGRIEELAKKQQIRVLTTSITKREVRKKISEALTHARSALKKHEVIIHQLGISTDIAGDAADERLMTSFEQFLEKAKATEVPLNDNLEKLFDDYFQRRQPFGDGKKSEFPDAAVVDALKYFASQKGKKIYLVSGDPDLKNCCIEGSTLIHVQSLNEIISRATVTRKLHDDLLNFAAKDFFLKNAVRTQLKKAPVNVYGLARFADHLQVEASVDDVEDINIMTLNVISREPDRTLICEIDFEAYLSVSLTIEVGSRFEEEDSEMVWVFPSVEVTFEFDPDGLQTFFYRSAEIASTIDIDAFELDALRKFR